MKKVLVGAVVPAALVWGVVSHGQYSWRQKLTVTVGTPAGGERVGGERGP